MMHCTTPDTPENMRFFTPPRRPEESLLWSRDIRFVNRLAQLTPGGRLLELESGTCLIAPASELTEARAVEIARETKALEYGLVQVDASIAESDRYLVAHAAAVQQSGIADRVGMGQSVEVAHRKMLDLFFHLHHSVVFQPIVDLVSGHVHEWECLFRPDMPRLPGSIAQLVEMAIATNRAVELDAFIVARILDRIAAIDEARPAPPDRRRRYAINFTPASLLSPGFSTAAFAASVAAHGLIRRQITLECTEQMNIPDATGLARHVKELRKLGFGFAVDDAGAGYASFTLIAALRPSIIKIDRQIIRGIGDKRGDAKQALVEAFVSFGRRIGAELVAEGIETRRELLMLRSLGVTYGQGYLLGKPSVEPSAPRPLASLLPGGSTDADEHADAPKKRARVAGRVSKAPAGA
jgi:EAL domain-containing protein (putative c-di-GMP-specific phosphodiesterase class I)